MFIEVKRLDGNKIILNKNNICSVYINDNNETELELYNPDTGTVILKIREHYDDIRFLLV